MIPVNEPLLDGNEKKYLNECIDSGWISSEGPFVERFENEFAKISARKFGVAVCNGTAALELAVQALEIGPGDEVILPTFTIISCAAAIIRAGAIPVPVDCDADTWNISVDRIEQHITLRTKAIMVVHTYGLPAEIDRIVDIANQYNLHVIEDAAHVHGHTYKDRPCGSFGTISVFSFYPNKVITSGEGGMVLTNDYKLSDKVRSLMNLCFQKERRFVHDELGWNYRISNLQAAVGVAQLEQLERFISIKKKNGNRYQSLLGDISTIQRPLSKIEGAENIYWVYGIVLNKELKISVNTLVQRLTESGIGTRPFFWPIHEQPVFTLQGMFSNLTLPNAERIARRGIYLPSGMALTEKQQVTVSTILHEVLA